MEGESCFTLFTDTQLYATRKLVTLDTRYANLVERPLYIHSQWKYAAEKYCQSTRTFLHKGNGDWFPLRAEAHTNIPPDC